MKYGYAVEIYWKLRNIEEAVDSLARNDHGKRLDDAFHPHTVIRRSVWALKDIMMENTL